MQDLLGLSRPDADADRGAELVVTEHLVEHLEQQVAGASGPVRRVTKLGCTTSDAFEWFTFN
jgi:hypothetical protein